MAGGLVYSGLDLVFARWPWVCYQGFSDPSLQDLADSFSLAVQRLMLTCPAPTPPTLSGAFHNTFQTYDSVGFVITSSFTTTAAPVAGYIFLTF